VDAYRYPEYYDIAFGAADYAAEVDFFEAATRKFSRTPVRRVFEIACGTATYLAEWQRHGYRYCGLDLSEAMLNLKTRILSSKERTTIQRADFNISGDSVEFDTNTRTGRLLGNVKMVITTQSQLLANPNQ